MPINFFAVFAIESTDIHLSTLSVYNHVQGTEMNITTDLLCSAFFDVTRYTTPLDENPIRYNHKTPVTAAWVKCGIFPIEYFQRRHQTDHSKIYVTIKDNKTGDQFITVIHATWDKNGIKKEIHFSNYHLSLRILMDYDDWYHSKTHVKMQLDALSK